MKEFQGGFPIQRNQCQIKRRQLNSIYSRGKIFHLLDKDYESAKDCYRQVIATASEIDWRRGMSYTYYWLAQSQIEQGELEKAQESINIGMAIAESNHHHRRLAYYKYALARLKTKQGLLQEGKQLMEESLREFKHLKIIPGFSAENVSSLLSGEDISELPPEMRSITHPPT
jgi:tetratricopeptide (TPR) repeat protein